MSWVETLVGIFTSGATTGIAGVFSGLLGGAVTAFTNYKMKKLQIEETKQEREHQREMMKLTTAQIVVEADAKIQINRETTRGKIEELEAAAYKASQESADKPLFYQEYMSYLTQVATSGRWYSFIAGFTVYLITLGFALVDIIKQTTRPGLTWYMTGMATYITMLAYDITYKSGMVMTIEQAYSLLTLVFNTILYLAVTSFAWWFSDRQVAKFIAKKIGWTNDK